MIRFAYTISYVADVNAALLFFENAFSMQRKFITPEGDYGELLTGETTLAFASHELGESNLPSGYVTATEVNKPLGVEIALVCSDVFAAHQAAMEHGADEIKAPETKPWGQIVSYVHSPSGNLIELCTEVKS